MNRLKNQLILAILLLFVECRAATIVLMWDSAPTVLTYKVWQSTGESPFSLTQQVSTNMAAVFGISTNVTTRFFVTALNAFGESTPSLTVTNLASPTNPPPTVIPSPSNLRATFVTGSRIDVAWTTSPQYWTHMQRAINGGPFIDFEILPPGTMHTTTRIRKGATFEFRCQAQDGYGNLSGFSNSVIIYAQ
ncbi:MAG: hypothetical protein V4563_14510 [Pseudomonadota bacterium]